MSSVISPVFSVHVIVLFRWAQHKTWGSNRDVELFVGRMVDTWIQHVVVCVDSIIPKFNCSELKKKSTNVH
jgi:hypothetical protein